MPPAPPPFRHARLWLALSGTLAACSPLPDPDPGFDAPEPEGYPALLPIDEVLEQAETAPRGSQEETAALARRAEALRQRAGALRRRSIDGD